MADQFIREFAGVEDTADPGGNGPNGFKLPQVKAFVELGALELLAKLPRAETETGGAESGFVEPFEVKQPQAPAAVIGSERNFTPSVGRFLHLGRHGSRPARNGNIVTAEHPGTRSGLLDDRPKELFGEIGPGATAECDISEAQ